MVETQEAMVLLSERMVGMVCVAGDVSVVAAIRTYRKRLYRLQVILVSVHAASHQQNASATITRIITTRTSFPYPRGFHVAHSLLLPPANNSRGYSMMKTHTFTLYNTKYTDAQPQD